MLKSPRLVAATLLLLSAPLTISAREHVEVVGSSTLYPLAAAVAEHAAGADGAGTYRIESTGTVAGIARFCAGAGLAHPDVLNASRRMRGAEIERCQDAGVGEIVEVKVGYDGISLATAAEVPMALTTKEIYLALARQVPNPAGNGALVDNPYQRWSQIDPRLPDAPIEVLGPPSTSGTRDAFGDLALKAGCGEIETIWQSFGRDRRRFHEVCTTLRTDGAYREAGEDDDAIVAELLSDPGLIGVFGFHFLEANKPRLKAIAINGVEPGLQSIAEGNYSLSRPLYVYFKKDNLARLPGIERYVQEFTSEDAWSEKGYLRVDGLIPMMLEERQKYAYIADHLVTPGCPPFCH